MSGNTEQHSGSAAGDWSKMGLELVDGVYAICRMDAHAPVPDTVYGPGLVSITRTADELSIVCPQYRAPSEAVVQSSWACIQVKGPLDFGLTGVLAGLADPLARAGISIFATSTFDTDYVLVRCADLERALAVLSDAGHFVV